jgi:hypothetical protein
MPGRRLGVPAVTIPARDDEPVTVSATWRRLLSPESAASLDLLLLAPPVFFT